MNKQVSTDSNFNIELLGVLLHFRLSSFAPVGDIEGIFLQAKVPLKHMDVLRFLFWKDGKPGSAIDEYRLTSHLFNGTWSPSTAAFA